MSSKFQKLVVKSLNKVELGGGLESLTLVNESGEQITVPASKFEVGMTYNVGDILTVESATITGEVPLEIASVVDGSDVQKSNDLKPTRPVRGRAKGSCASQTKLSNFA